MGKITEICGAPGTGKTQFRCDELFVPMDPLCETQWWLAVAIICIVCSWQWMCVFLNCLVALREKLCLLVNKCVNN